MFCYSFLYFLDEWAISGFKFGFYEPNSIQYQLGKVRGQDYVENVVSMKMVNSFYRVVLKIMMLKYIYFYKNIGFSLLISS